MSNEYPDPLDLFAVSEDPAVTKETIATLEKALYEYRERLDYASQLLSLVVAKAGGRIELTTEDLDATVSGVEISNVEDSGFILTTFVDTPTVSDEESSPLP